MLLIFIISLPLGATEVKEHCLKDINDVLKLADNNSIEHKIYQGIFIKESESFCNCLDKIFAPQKKILGINPYFLNPESRFTQEDHCRHENYKEGTFEISTMLAFKHLQEIVQERIHNHYIKGIWLLASPESISRKFLCMEDKIHQKCLRTGSGGISYHCILYTMSSGKAMSELDNDCPQFETINYSSPII